MKVTPIRTDIVYASQTGINQIIKNALAEIPENAVLAISSKIVSLCEGNVFMADKIDRDELIREQADLYLPKGDNPYGVYLTIKNNTLIPNAGVDESNADGYYVPWPENPYASAQRCWNFIREQYGVKHTGIIITDSTDTPLKWGVTGVSIAHCGFDAVNDKRQSRDLFGHPLKMTKINVADALGAAAVLCMGESAESTPLALIEDIPFVDFKQHPPTPEEISAQHIGLNEDVFGALLHAAPWKRTKK